MSVATAAHLFRDSYRDASRWSVMFGRDVEMSGAIHEGGALRLAWVRPLYRDDGTREPGVFVPSVMDPDGTSVLEAVRPLDVENITAWFLANGFDPREAEWHESASASPCHPTQVRYAYFMLSRPCGLVKIGSSVSPETRLNTVCSMSPAPVELVGMLPGGYEKEAELHERFGHLREHGEWFRYTEELRRYVLANA